jgi:hypothetical protein
MKNTINVSQLTITAGINLRVETKTDAYRLIGSLPALQRYIAEFGDVVVEFDKRWNVYRVPEFKEQIERYTEMKSRECAKWGSE